MAEAIVSGVVQRLGNLLIQESNFLSGVSDQVKQLQTELKLMQCLLKDADAKQDESHFVRQLVAEIRDLAYDADDIIATYALKVASRRGGGIKNVLKRYACIIDEGTTIHKVGSEIPKIMTRISNLTTRLLAMGIRESTEGGRLSSLSEKEQKQRQTYSYLEHDPVGFDDHRNELVEFLLKEEEGKRIASICGMGGLGKTTLAKMVYRHDRVRQHFDHHAWIFVSQQFQIRDIWERILFSLLSPSEEEWKKIRKLSDEDIVEKLRQVQCEKKCLVILDDIWHIEDWNRLRLREAFPESGSKMLLTTRNRDVASHADPRGLLHELHCLNEEKSLELFKKIAISWREDCLTNANIEKLGKEMIEYCGGLPLAITVLGGLLATKQRQDEWEDVLKHIKSYIFKEDDLRVNNVLGLSYNDLPCHLKPCFLYLGHFPEDFEILKDELIQMWMGEGFIQLREDSEDTMEYEGEQYLRELKQRYMVQVGEISKFGGFETYRIHDLMREFCISKAQQENFLQITKKNIHSMEGSQWHIGKVRRLAITLESNDNYLEGIKFSEYPYLRSLLCFVPSKEFYFKKSKLLRVLNMKNYKGKNFPKDIGRFIHLRFLSLEESNINKVPSSLCNLRCLQTLDLRLTHYRVRVPNVFKEMEQLRHLYLPYWYEVSEKLELGNLCYLQTLLNVGSETIKMPTSFRFNYLRILGFSNQFYRPLLGMKIGEVPHVIQILSSCPRVYELVLENCIKKLPETHQFPPNLAELTLVQTFLAEDPMPTLEKLPNLKILRLLQNSFEGKDMDCSEGGFPLLQYLLLERLYCLEEWRVEEGAMPSLSHLKINFCIRLKTIPDGLRFVTTLQQLKIRNMYKSFKDRLDEGGLDFDKVKHVPSLVFQNCD